MLDDTEDLPFEAIAQYVGSHPHFTAIAETHKLFFYALYKTTKGKAPDYRLPKRLRLFFCQQQEYQKWLTWWVMCHAFDARQAEKEYYTLAKDIDAFPNFAQLTIMKTSKGRQLSSLRSADQGRCLRDNMDTLIEACHEDDIHEVNAYLRRYGDVNVQNEEGTSLLHFAVDFKALDIVRLLLQNGVNVNSLDDQGASPLDYASINIALSDEDGFEEVAAILREHGGREGTHLV